MTLCWACAEVGKEDRPGRRNRKREDVAAPPEGDVDMRRSPAEAEVMLRHLGGTSAVGPHDQKGAAVRELGTCALVRLTGAALKRDRRDHASGWIARVAPLRNHRDASGKRSHGAGEDESAVPHAPVRATLRGHALTLAVRGATRGSINVDPELRTGSGPARALSTCLSFGALRPYFPFRFPFCA
jgi:hypothetical protein